MQTAWPARATRTAAAVARLAAEAEEVGWHGVFVWDHVRWQAPVRQVADPWITLAEIATTITELRQPATTPYDIAVGLPPGTDPAPYAKVGATWWLAEFAPETVTLDQVRGVLRDGPADIGIERIL